MRGDTMVDEHAEKEIFSLVFLLPLSRVKKVKTANESIPKVELLYVLASNSFRLPTRSFLILVKPRFNFAVSSALADGRFSFFATERKSEAEKDK